MRLGSFIAGIFATILVLAIIGMIYVQRSNGLSARGIPSRAEAWLADEARDFAMPKAAAQRANPIPNSPEVIAEGRAHWADHCASCHGNNGSGDTQMGRNLYPPVPDMRQEDTQKMTDGELFFIIENGVRLTGMPAWGGAGRTDEDSWKLVRFIRHLPQVTQEEEMEMEKLNPKSPDDLKEEQEEQDFLNGADTDAPTEHHHHH